MAESDKHCVTIINSSSGGMINSFGEQGSGQAQFLSPYGVALSQDGHIVVADGENHRLQVLTTEGAFVSAVGSKGSQPLQFQQPWDVAVHRSGKLFVTDSGNNRIQVLNANLTYSQSFGSKGTLPGEFNNPRGIAIDSEGTVYVADCDNNRVQKITFGDNVLQLAAVIDSKGEEHGHLNNPYGVCVDNNDILYVTECGSNTVCTFRTSGQFLEYVGRGDGSFQYPLYITSDIFPPGKSGKLYISDNSGVVAFSCYQTEKDKKS